MQQSDTLNVNSFHHQGVKIIAPEFSPVAFASDSLIEGIEALPNRAIFGVQWHPEALFAGGDEPMLLPFSYLIKKAIVFKKQKTYIGEFSHWIPIATRHCNFVNRIFQSVYAIRI
jgi:gamma-glutamyl-gamma-aminobutyrate hydrolase PuuD